MFTNHLKIAWRSILKDKMFTSIKIGGFAIGIMACLLITLFILDELSYDKHYKDADNIYRIGRQGVLNGEDFGGIHMPAPFAATLKAQIPEVEKSGRILVSELHGSGGKEIRPSGSIQNNYEQGFAYIDPEMLEILDFTMLSGDIKNALSTPNSIVITKKKAAKYFPDEEAVGKTLIFDDNTEKPYYIGGVIDDLPKNSHFQFEFLITLKDKEFFYGDQTSWTNHNYHTYVLFRPNTNMNEIEAKLLDIKKTFYVPAFKNRSAEYMEVMSTIKFGMQNIQDIHLRNEVFEDGLNHGDIRFIWLFGAIAGFILLLACINFINLSTAKSANRAKEVGLRKTVGAFRKNLIMQFLIESVLFSIISFVVGIILAWVLLPYFNEIASKDLLLPWGKTWFLPTLLFSSLLIGVIAGLYPSFYLSTFKPIDVLKGSLSIGSKSGRLRSTLVVFQFTTSVVLIIGTLIIGEQMDYIQNKKLGYDKEQVVTIEGTNTLDSKLETFKRELNALTEVNAVTASSYLPITGTTRNNNYFRIENGNAKNEGAGGQIWRVDHEYIKTLGITIKEGRNFAIGKASDSTDAIIINEAMVKQLGLKNPIGKKISNGHSYTIIGVVGDFHFSTLKDKIEPLSLVIGQENKMIALRVDTANMDALLNDVTTIWNKFSPNQTIRYSFLDQKFAKMHEDVKRMGAIFNSFSLFAILVACLGLFALSAFMIEQRNKEISIRMVLGASFQNIYQLLSFDFLKLILISISIAVPIGWYVMNRWLEDFEYSIDIGWEVFAYSGILAIVVAILTISYQSIGAAFINPLKSLRAE
ncbi:ABC transporter permease [Aquimarina sediminis]|uniref:ABC transporter permease n=1 Tax=Aquimarina sediminis TaxID=2070536 RepID=UPI000C9FFF7B|nr:ABC transporter permease [Aquimarina sediminis]